MSEVQCLKVVYSSYVYISSYDYKSLIYYLNIVSFEDSKNKFQIFCEIVRISSFRGKNDEILNELNVHMGFPLPSKKIKGMKKNAILINTLSSKRVGNHCYIYFNYLT